MAYSMDPRLGMEAVQVMEKELNGEILLTVQESYSAVKSLGDNSLVEQMDTKFKKLSDFYNTTYLTALNAVKKNLEEYTDFAEYVSKLQADTNLKTQDIDPAKDAGFADAVGSL